MDLPAVAWFLHLKHVALVPVPQIVIEHNVRHADSMSHKMSMLSDYGRLSPKDMSGDFHMASPMQASVMLVLHGQMQLEVPSQSCRLGGEAPSAELYMAAVAGAGVGSARGEVRAYIYGHAEPGSNCRDRKAMLARDIHGLESRQRG